MVGVFSLPALAGCRLRNWRTDTARCRHQILWKCILLGGALKAVLPARCCGAHVAFEYEKDANDPLAGLAKSVGYARGANEFLEKLPFDIPHAALER